jgi:hypothetical protein
MPSIDPSQVPEIVEGIGYPIMFEEYEERPLLYPSLVRLHEPLALSTPNYGHKAQVISGQERFKEREDSQDIEMASIKDGYTWRMKCRMFDRGFEVPNRMLESADAQRNVEGLVRQMTTGFGRNARLQKEDFVAGVYQKGTLTAGSTAYFGNSYVGEVDSNSGFIYDGLPFFDTAHTLAAASGTYSNHTASLALTAANLQTVLIAMRNANAVDERGERISIRPDTLMVPPALEYTARTILESVNLPGSGNNDANVVRGALELIVNPALTDAASAAAWWVGERGRGVEVVDSGAPRIEVSYDAKRKSTIVTLGYYFGASVSNWRYWYCANKAAS